MTRRLAPLAVVALLSASAGFGHAALTTDVPPACHTVEVGDHLPITGAEIDALFELGYTGRAGDGAERLYSPECAR